MPSITVPQVAQGWWTQLPVGRVTHILDTSLDAIRVALDPLPDGAPPFVIYQPDRASLKLDQIALMQHELERAAVKLFPAWLPGAEHIAGAKGAGVAAVRLMAADRARVRKQFAPFVSDRAEAAVRGTHQIDGAYAPQIRATGAAWAIAEAYDSAYTALVMDIPDGLSEAAGKKLVSAADWIAGNSGTSVWLTGALPSTVDKYVAVSLNLAPLLQDRTGEFLRTEPLAVADDPLFVEVPPLAGVPRADSRAECTLEQALSRHGWAVGRSWNQTYTSSRLARPFRLDLWWKAEKCVVEVDGPEHHEPVHYAADRRRDVQLQLDGHAVLRYTNDQVLGDLDRVILEIGRLIRSRRKQ